MTLPDPSPKPYARLYPHLVLFPGPAIIVSVLGLNLLADEVRDVWDPQLLGRAGDA